VTKTTVLPDSQALQAEFQNAAKLQGRGDFENAIASYEALLKKAPGHPQILNLCAVSNLEMGRREKAIKLFEQAVESAPDYQDAWLNLGIARLQAGDHESAAEAFGQVRRISPDSPVGHTHFANACQLLDRYDDAVAAYEAALAAAPDNPDIWTNYARANLYSGNWTKALDTANTAIGLKKANTGAMSVKSAALLELGEKEELDKLVDFDRLIQVSDFSAPGRFTDMSAFNEALCEHCRNHPSLVYEPSENTTKMGHQTGNLFLDDDRGPIADLLEMIGQAVKAYQEARPADESHPFLAHPPARWKYDIWATILGSQGHQAPHIHRSGWLSGCYYARIPDVMASGDGQEGWIEFGRPQDHPESKAEPVVRAYKPHEGMVVLFPSYFYHRTIPFESDEQRISIAFDIVPVQ